MHLPVGLNLDAALVLRVFKIELRGDHHTIEMILETT
jgi:hypothetical protein